MYGGHTKSPYPGELGGIAEINHLNGLYVAGVGGGTGHIMVFLAFVDHIDKGVDLHPFGSAGGIVTIAIVDLLKTANHLRKTAQSVGRDIAVPPLTGEIGGIGAGCQVQVPLPIGVVAKLSVRHKFDNGIHFLFGIHRIIGLCSDHFVEPVNDNLCGTISGGYTSRTGRNLQSFNSCSSTGVIWAVTTS